MIIYRVSIAVEFLPWQEDYRGMEDETDKIVTLFSERVRALREKSGASQEKFALDAGIDRSYYGKIERNQANPTLRQLIAISRELGIPLEKLFKGLGPGKKPAKKPKS